MVTCTFLLLLAYSNCAPVDMQYDGGSTTVPNPGPDPEFSSGVKAMLSISNAFCEKHVQAALIPASEREVCFNAFLADSRPLDLFCGNCDSKTIAQLVAANPPSTDSMIYDKEGAEICYAAILTDTHATNYALTANDRFSYDYLSDLVNRTPACYQFIVDESPRILTTRSSTTTTTTSPSTTTTSPSTTTTSPSTTTTSPSTTTTSPSTTTTSPSTTTTSPSTTTTSTTQPTPMACSPTYPLRDHTGWTGPTFGSWISGSYQGTSIQAYSFSTGDAVSILFRTPAEVPPPVRGNFGGDFFQGDGDGDMQVTISEMLGCMDPSKLPSDCSATGRGAKVFWSFNPEPGRCLLKTATNYYYNVTYGNANSCARGGPCCRSSVCSSRLRNEMY